MRIRLVLTGLFSLLIIEVTNAREVVRQRIGRLGERLVGKIVDPDEHVERELIKEMELAFQEFGIEARILSVSGMSLDGTNSLDISMKVRSEKDVYIKED